MESSNIIPANLANALVNLNILYKNCEEETCKLIRENWNIEGYIDELDEAYCQLQDVISRIIAVSAKDNAQKIAEGK